MASKKQRRKSARRARSEAQPPVPTRHPDGDRRRRGGMTYEQGLALKRLLQQPLPKNPSEEEE
jgi:hypothetical protein